MPITPVPSSSVDPVAQVVAALEAATAALAAAALTLADKGSWVTSTAYAVGDVVTQAGQRYCCRTAHTSGTFATDLAASKWVSLDAVAAAASVRTVTAGTGLTGGGDLSADRTLAVSYGTTSGTAAQGSDSRITGALQSANNLSDVTAASARANLGLDLGLSGRKTGDIASGLPTNLFSTYAPDLTLVLLGTNDINASVSASTYQSNLTTALITPGLTQGSVGLVTPPCDPSAAGSHTSTNITAYVAALKSLADTNILAVVDLNARMTAYSTGLLADTTGHLTNRGAWDFASAVTGIIGQQVAL